jgi:hypothetical protein
MATLQRFYEDNMWCRDTHPNDTLYDGTTVQTAALSVATLIRHNNTQCKNTKHNDTQCKNTKHNDTQCKNTIATKPSIMTLSI